MAAKSQTWEQVGKKFEVLGEDLRAHFDELRADTATERAAFEKSVRGLLSALEDGFGAAGKALRDPALREDVTSVATSVRDALVATFETAEGEMHERLSRPRRRARATMTSAAARKATPRKTSPGKTSARTTSARTTSARKTSPRKTTAKDRKSVV